MDADLGLTQNRHLPLACSLGPEDGQARMRRWQQLHEDAGPVARLNAGRLEVWYQSGPGLLAELSDLAAAEQTCCSFVTWSVSEVDGQAVPHVLAPADTPEAVEPIAALFGATSTA